MKPQFRPTNPYHVMGRSVLSFSGGRTSAYMLRKTLDAYDGELPRDMHVCFANTGREMEATLEFVKECGEHWDVPIHWLEYRLVDGEHSFTEVTFETASRNGEPFEQVLQTRAILPNPRARYCTHEMKIMTIQRWLVSRYGKGQPCTQIVGLRADEPKRVQRLTDPDREATVPMELRGAVAPLYAAGVTKEHVMEFWQQQNFDLRLQGDWEGNCDGCFLKRQTSIRRISVDHPERIAWWVKQEELIKERIAEAGVGARFRQDWRGGYAGVVEKGRPSVFFRDDDDGMDVMLECEGGCGV